MNLIHIFTIFNQFFNVPILMFHVVYIRKVKKMGLFFAILEHFSL